MESSSPYVLLTVLRWLMRTRCISRGRYEVLPYAQSRYSVLCTYIHTYIHTYIYIGAEFLTRYGIPPGPYRMDGWSRFVSTALYGVLRTEYAGCIPLISFRMGRLFASFLALSMYVCMYVLRMYSSKPILYESRGRAYSVQCLLGFVFTC